MIKIGMMIGDRYEILEKIGTGGMSDVYKAKCHKLNRYVAIKVLKQEFSENANFVSKFRIEAQAAAGLMHPNIVNVYDVGEENGIYYIVMELVEGITLKKYIEKKARLSYKEAVSIAIQVSMGIEAAHNNHIIHRDIKPQNIIISKDGNVKVTDFGIARAATASTMTTTANAAGSVHYFSPEQARGGYVDEKSDIYSLGITMFEMITGVLPFQGNNSVSIALMHINDELPDIRQYNPNCTRSLEGIIRKATMKKADERYASIDLLLADLIRARAELNGSAKEEKPAEKKAAAVGAAAAGAAGVRMSRRAEAAARLREAQEKTEMEKAAQAAVETPQETKPADPKELEYIRSHAERPHAERAHAEHSYAEHAHAEGHHASHRHAAENAAEPLDDFAQENPVEEEAHTPLAGLEKYGKKLKMKHISKEDDYENEYVKSEPVKASRRPGKIRRNPRTEGDFDNEHDRKAERKVVIAAVITALVLIGVISVVGIKFMGGGFGGFISSDKNIETPLFLAMDYDEAVKEAEKMGITLVQEGEDYSSFYDTGCIIYQSVNEGTMIGEGTKIGVKVSLGLTEEEMPNVVGKSENAAIEAITRLVGDVAEIRYVHDADAKPSEVIKQEPEAGASITAKSRIILTISKGDEDTNVTVPNVVNDTLEDAKASLTAVGLTVGNVSYAASDKVAEGKVITQTVAANKSVPSGSVVNLVVSSGADTQENENNKPSSNTQTQGTKYFTINAPSGSEGSVYVRVVKEDADGVYPVVDTYRDASEFPYSVSVTGKGSGTVTCYIDNVQQWSQSVNFSG